MGMRASQSVRYVVMVAGFAAVLAALQAKRVHAAHDMQEMAGHMTMTELRPMQPGDQARADAIVAAARKVTDQYTVALTTYVPAWDQVCEQSVVAPGAEAL